MMRNTYGHRIANWRPGWHGQRVGQWCPRHRQTNLQVVAFLRWYHYRWTPYIGWECVATGSKGQPVTAPHNLYLTHKELMMKRRNLPAGTGIVQPALPSASLMLGKLPAVREFLTATEYEDKTARTPGYLTVRNRQVTFEVTLYDPDSGSRLSARAAKLDDVLALVEQLLGVEEAPWEVDPYLTEQLSRRRKKRGKVS